MPRSGRSTSYKRTHSSSSTGLSSRAEAGWLMAFGVLGGFMLTAGIGLSVLAIGFGESSSAASGGGGALSPLEGKRIYAARCASCHGAGGEGGIGLPLGDGAVVEKFPDIEAQMAVIADGRNAMPGFGSTLSAEQIEAVATFEREELGR